MCLKWDDAEWGWENVLDEAEKSALRSVRGAKKQAEVVAPLVQRIIDKLATREENIRPFKQQ